MLNRSRTYSYSGTILSDVSYGPTVIPAPSLVNQYSASPNTSKMKVWLEHKGEKVYLTETQRSKTLWNPEGLDKPIILNRRIFMMPEYEPSYAIRQDFHQEHYDDRALYDAIMRRAATLRPDMKYDKNELLTLALAEANDVTFDVGTFLGELPETIKFLGAVVVKLIKIFAAIKRGEGLKNVEQYFRKGMSMRLADDSSDVWLAYRYAIMPLIYSLQDGLAALEPPESQFIRTRVRDSFVDEGEDNFVVLKDQILGTCSYRYEVIARAQVYTILTAKQAQKRNTLMGPFTTAWELIPLSFVVDWVLQVGAFIASFRMLPFESQGITYSVKSQMEIVASATAISLPEAPYRNFGDKYKVEVENTGERNLGYSSVSYDRAVVNSFAHEIPFGVKMNLCRTVDAFALSFKIGKGLLSKK